MIIARKDTTFLRNISTFSIRCALTVPVVAFYRYALILSSLTVNISKTNIWKDIINTLMFLLLFLLKNVITLQQFLTDFYGLRVFFNMKLKI
jgi:hypothetical protein